MGKNCLQNKKTSNKTISVIACSQGEKKIFGKKTCLVTTPKNEFNKRITKASKRKLNRNQAICGKTLVPNRREVRQALDQIKGQVSGEIHQTKSLSSPK